MIERFDSKLDYPLWTTIDLKMKTPST